MSKIFRAKEAPQRIVENFVYTRLVCIKSNLSLGVWQDILVGFIIFSNVALDIFDILPFKVVSHEKQEILLGFL